MSTIDKNGTEWQRYVEVYQWGKAWKVVVADRPLNDWNAMGRIVLRQEFRTERAARAAAARLAA